VDDDDDEVPGAGGFEAEQLPLSCQRIAPLLHLSQLRVQLHNFICTIMFHSDNWCHLYSTCRSSGFFSLYVFTCDQ
jgi:hypothetical protein